MNEMRGIAERISAIRARRAELAALRPTDRALAEELSALEADASRFAENCTRYHKLNLCQAGFVYGDVLRHPADPAAGVAVRLGDRVEIVEGPDMQDGEMPLMEATAILGRRLKRGLGFRDWHLDGSTVGAREDDLFLRKRGLSPPAPARAPVMPAERATSEGTAPAAPDPLDADDKGTTAPSPDARRPPRAKRSRQDDRTPDLFG